MNPEKTESTYVSSESFFPLLRETLDRGKAVSFTPRGTSMLPTFRDGRDTVLLVPLREPPRRLDILLYRYPSGRYVLHRVVKRKKDGSLLICGDNLTRIEKVEPNQIIAVVESFTRDSKRIDCRHSLRYRLRSEIRVRTRPIRALFSISKRRMRRIRKILFRFRKGK